MESPAPPPARPRTGFDGLRGLEGVLLPQGWVTAGAVVLWLVVGLTGIARFEGVQIWQWGWRVGTVDVREVGDWMPLGDLLALYGAGFLLTWPFVLGHGVVRELVDRSSRTRFTPERESSRSWVQIATMAAVYTPLAVAWGAGLVFVLNRWPQGARLVGALVSGWLVLLSVVYVVKSVTRRLRTSAE